MPQQNVSLSYYDSELLKLIKDARHLLTMEEGNILVQCDVVQERPRSHFSSVYQMRRNAWVKRADEALGKETQ